eukprot:15460325-Alexandrium_andersonii.AAC.2
MVNGTSEHATPCKNDREEDTDPTMDEQGCERYPSNSCVARFRMECFMQERTASASHVIPHAFHKRC